MKIGIAVKCRTCGRMKQPHGRSAPIESSYCDRDSCIGYDDTPKPGCLWPGETAEDFGYPSCNHATRQ